MGKCFACGQSIVSDVQHQRAGDKMTMRQKIEGVRDAWAQMYAHEGMSEAVDVEKAILAALDESAEADLRCALLEQEVEYKAESIRILNSEAWRKDAETRKEIAKHNEARDVFISMVKCGILSPQGDAALGFLLEYFRVPR
jgi:hypothetical protein